jgi:AcrR family transcriptional regulator
MSAAERREQLLDVGRSVFAERGYAGAAVEEIASRAGVTKPVVYEHFGGKEGLYAVVVDRELAILTERAAEALSAGSARMRTERAADAFLTYIEERPEGFRVLTRDTPAPAVASSGGSSFGNLIGDVATTVERLLAKEIADRGFDGAAAPIYSRAVIGLIVHVGQWWMEAGAPSRPEVVAHIVNIVWNGLEHLDKQPVLPSA